MKGLLSFLLPTLLAGSIAYGFYSIPSVQSSYNTANQEGINVQNLIGHANQLPAPEKIGDSFAGNWYLENTEIITSDIFPADKEYGLEDCIWADLAVGDSPLKINADGTGSFSREGETKYINVYAKRDEGILQILFQDKNKQSRTDFSYTLNGNSLELSHIDPMVSEKYTFSKR